MDKQYLIAVCGYEKLMEDYIDSIYKSGMLLDEHDDLLRQFWKVPIIRKQYHGYAICTSAVLCGTILFLNNKSYIPLGISLVPLGLKCLFDGIKYTTINNYKVKFSKLTVLLRKQFRLNKTVVQYYQERKRIIKNFENTTKEIIINIMSAKIVNFLLAVSKNLLNIINVLNGMLEKINDVVDIGELNFIYSVNISLQDFVNFEESDEELLLAYFERLQLLYVLVTSTFLCGIGLSLCVTEWKVNNDKFVKIFSSIIPECCKNVEHFHKIISDDFNKICDSFLEVPAQNSPSNICSDAPLTTSLKRIMNYTQLIFEIANGMHTYVTCEKNNGKDENVLKNSLKDVEDLFEHTKSSLDVLQHIIYTDVTRTSAVNMRSFHDSKSVDQEVSEETPFIRYNDPDILIDDEEFTCYLGSDTASDYAPSTMEYEQLRDVIKTQKCLIEELNRELKNRKLITQKEEDPKPAETPVAEEKHPTVAVNVPLKPPPPPLPNLLHSTGTSNESTVKDFVSQIEEAAHNWGVKEIVFGDFVSTDQEQDAID